MALSLLVSNTTGRKDEPNTSYSLQTEGLRKSDSSNTNEIKSQTLMVSFSEIRGSK